jgi:hypothetical protein
VHFIFNAAGGHPLSINVRRLFQRRGTYFEGIPSALYQG